LIRGPGALFEGWEPSFAGFEVLPRERGRSTPYHLTLYWWYHEVCLLSSTCYHTSTILTLNHRWAVFLIRIIRRSFTLCLQLRSLFLPQLPHIFISCLTIFSDPPQFPAQMRSPWLNLQDLSCNSPFNNRSRPNDPLFHSNRVDHRSYFTRGLCRYMPFDNVVDVLEKFLLDSY